MADFCPRELVDELRARLRGKADDPFRVPFPPTGAISSR